MCNHYSQEMFLCPTVQWLVRIPILSVPPHPQEIKRGTQTLRFEQHLQECQVAGTCQGKSILCGSGIGREAMEPSSPALPRRRRWCGRGSRSAARWVCQQSPSGAGPDTTGRGRAVGEMEGAARSRTAASRAAQVKHDPSATPAAPPAAAGDAGGFTGT